MLNNIVIMALTTVDERIRQLKRTVKFIDACLVKPGAIEPFIPHLRAIAQVLDEYDTGMHFRIDWNEEIPVEVNIRQLTSDQINLSKIQMAKAQIVNDRSFLLELKNKVLYIANRMGQLVWVDVRYNRRREIMSVYLWGQRRFIVPATLGDIFDLPEDMIKPMSQSTKPCKGCSQQQVDCAYKTLKSFIDSHSDQMIGYEYYLGNQNVVYVGSLSDE